MSWIERLFGVSRAAVPGKSRRTARPPSDASTASVVELARALMTHLRERAPDFDRGFYRAVIESGVYDQRASYIVGSEATLVDVLQERALFEQVGQLGWLLFSQLGMKQGVLLLIVDKSCEYEIKFEQEDLKRWNITKLDGGAGLPAGL